MRYFIMKQNTNLLYGIKIKEQVKRSRLLKDSEPSNIFYLDGTGRETRPDFIEKPVRMISGFLKKIISLHQAEIHFENAALIHQENSLQYSYVKMELPSIDAISDYTEYYPNQTVKRLILSRKKIGGHKIFLMADSRIPHPVVSLSVVESLLRRKAKGILFEEVEVDDDAGQ